MGEIYDEFREEQAECERLFAQSIFQGIVPGREDSLSFLLPEMFIDEKLGEYWKRVRDLRCDGEAAVSIAFDLGLAIEFSKEISREGAPNVFYIETFARKIEENYTYRKTLETITQMVNCVAKRDLMGVKQKSSELSQLSLSGASDLITARSLGDEFILQMADGFHSFSSGLPEIDSILNGMFPGDHVLVGGETGVGKTALGLQVARQVAMMYPSEKTMIASLEMQRVQLWGRMACPLAGYAWSDLRAGRLNDKPDALQAISAATLGLQNKLGDRLIIEDRYKDLPSLYRTVMKVRPKFLLIDHFGEIVWHGKESDQVRWYGEAAKFIRDYFAKGTGACVWSIVPLSRPKEGGSKHVDLNRIKWSGDLEYNADAVFFLMRPDLLDDEVQRTGDVVSVNATVKKNRQGDVGAMATIPFDLKKQWYGDPRAMSGDRRLEMRSVNDLERRGNGSEKEKFNLWLGDKD